MRHHKIVFGFTAISCIFCGLECLTELLITSVININNIIYCGKGCILPAQRGELAQTWGAFLDPCAGVNLCLCPFLAMFYASVSVFTARNAFRASAMPREEVIGTAPKTPWR